MREVVNANPPFGKRKARAHDTDLTVVIKFSDGNAEDRRRCVEALLLLLQRRPMQVDDDLAKAA